MRKTNQHISIIAIITILLTLVPFIFANTLSETEVIELLAGQDMDVGEVRISNDLENIYVQ